MTSAYRAPASRPASQNPAFYFRASPGAPQKGPFSVDALRESLDRGRIKSSGEVRSEDGGDWIPLRRLLEMPEAAPVKRAPYDDRAAASPVVRGSSSIGPVLIALGVVLTGVFLVIAPGGHVVVFTGLIVSGIARTIRDRREH